MKTARIVSTSKPAVPVWPSSDPPAENRQGTSRRQRVSDKVALGCQKSCLAVDLFKEAAGFE